MYAYCMYILLVLWDNNSKQYFKVSSLYKYMCIVKHPTIIPVQSRVRMYIQDFSVSPSRILPSAPWEKYFCQLIALVVKCTQNLLWVAVVNDVVCLGSCPIRHQVSDASAYVVQP